MRLLIIGATGGTGLQVTSQAVEGGHRVTAFVRSPQNLGSLRQRVVVREGDPRRVADLRDMLPGHDGVISTLGPAGGGPTTILRAAAESTVAAMQAAGVRRLLVVSAAVLFDDLGLAGKILRHTLLMIAKPAAGESLVVLALASMVAITTSLTRRTTPSAAVQGYR